MFIEFCKIWIKSIDKRESMMLIILGGFLGYMYMIFDLVF